MRYLFFIFPVLLSSCVRFQPSSVRVSMPINRLPDAVLSHDLYEALQSELQGAGLPQLSIQTTIIDAPSQDALIGMQGVAFTQDLSMTVNVECRDTQGKMFWKGSVTGRSRLWKPRAQKEYAHVFAEARRDMCHDVARALRNKCT